MKIWIPAVRPDLEHWKGLRPIAKSLSKKYSLEIVEGTEIPDGRLVVVGHHLLGEGDYDISKLEGGSILVNTEYEIGKPISRWESLDKSEIKTFDWIDIVPENLGKWGVFEPIIPWDVELCGERIECDVLFTGCLNERRLKILRGLKDAGLDVVVPSGYDGNEKYRRGAKIVLDCHYDLYGMNERFQFLRVMEGMLHKTCVIAESKGGYYGDKLKFGFVPAKYDDLIDTCVEYINKPLKREAVISRIPLALSTLTDGDRNIAI